MQKKSVLPVLGILLINFVSAQFYSGYNRFSITGFFSSINPDDMILITLFIIIFALVNFSLGRVLKDSYGNPNKPVAGVISLSVAILAVYSLWRTGFDISGLFYNVGVSEDILFFIIPIILLVAAIIIIWKFGFAALFLIFGSFITLITWFTDLIYEKGIALTIGIFLLLIALGLWWKKRRDGLGYESGISATGRGIGRGAWGAAKWAGGKIKQKQIQRQQQMQQEQQRAQTRQDIRHQVHDTINEIRRIDKEVKSTAGRITRANNKGNQQQAFALEQHRASLRQQRINLENRLRTLRRQHSGNI